jgi:type 1 glutamine amidotransferase
MNKLRFSCLCGLLAAVLASVLSTATALHAEEVRAETPKLKGLLIIGGCCHDYVRQTEIITEGMSQRASISWDVVHESDAAQTKISIYDKPDWSNGYDVVVHNECYGAIDDVDFVKKIVAGHTETGVPAIVIHCAMHTYRAAKIDDWREFLGVTSRRHEHQSRYTVNIVAKDNPIMQGFPDEHKMPIDELYVIEKTWDNTKVLATSKSEKDGKEYPVIWTNKYGKARVFGTTYGHSSETFGDEKFLNVLTRGILWAASGQDE